MSYMTNKKSFEYKLRSICIKNKLGWMLDVTEDFIQSGLAYNEQVYLIRIPNKYMDVLVFSGIRYNYNRDDVGTNDVRILVRWRTKQWGNIYMRIGRCYKNNDMYEKIEKILLTNKNAVFTYRPKQFTINIDNVK